MIQGFNSLSYILQGWFGGWASGVSGERTSQPGKIKKKLWNLSVGAWPSQDEARVKPDGVMPECVPVNPNQLPPKWVKNKCVSKCLNSSKTNNAIKKFLGGDIFDT